MFASVPYDLGLVLITGGIGLVIGTLIISIIEAIVLLLIKWDTFWQSLRASLLMNVASTIFGIIGSFIIVGGLVNANRVAFADVSVWLSVSIAFLLSVLIEAGILMLIKRDSVSQNWKAGLIANITSYLLIILPFGVNALASL